MRCDGTDALNLIGADGDAETGTAYEEGTVDLPVGHQLGGGGGAVRICRLIVDYETTDVCYGFDTRVVLEVSLDLVFVVDTGVLVKEQESCQFSRFLLLGALNIAEGGLMGNIATIHPQPRQFSISERPFCLDWEDTESEKRGL